MKKLGTPSGAGPGSAKEKVGLAGVGTPCGVLAAGALAGFLAVGAEGAAPMLMPPAPPATRGDFEPFDPLEPLPLFGLPLPGELGEVCDEVVVVGVELGVVLVEPGVVVVTVGVVEVDVGVHEACTFLTGPVPGGTSEEVGVPGGTLTLKVRVWPVSRVTVTVHWSAEAIGIAARLIATAMAPALIPAILSFRLLDTAVYLLPPDPPRAKRSAPPYKGDAPW